MRDLDLQPSAIDIIKDGGNPLSGTRITMASSPVPIAEEPGAIRYAVDTFRRLRLHYPGDQLEMRRFLDDSWREVNEWGAVNSIAQELTESFRLGRRMDISRNIVAANSLIYGGLPGSGVDWLMHIQLIKGESYGDGIPTGGAWIQKKRSGIYASYISLRQQR